MSIEVSANPMLFAKRECVIVYVCVCVICVSVYYTERSQALRSGPFAERTL